MVKASASEFLAIVQRLTGQNQNQFKRTRPRRIHKRFTEDQEGINSFSNETPNSKIAAGNIVDESLLMNSMSMVEFDIDSWFLDVPN